MGIERLNCREIGSEFWDIPQSDTAASCFPLGVRWYRSGRGALGAVLDSILGRGPVKTVALPSWCCETMIAPFLSRGIGVRFYPVVADERGHLRQVLPEPGFADLLLVMDYFGYARSMPVPSGWGCVIRDVTHSLFCGVPSEADYVYGSLRKWAGFWTGGYAWSVEGLLPQTPVQIGEDDYSALRKQAMEEKKAYLTGAVSEKRHLQTFSQAETLLDTDSQGDAAKRDIQAARALDIPFLRERRRRNAGQLLEAVREFALFPTLEPKDCPLFVPILLPHDTRDALRRYLIGQEIYCPVHWPLSPLHRCNQAERRLYEESLSLVCDQRYDGEDMGRLLEAIHHFGKGNR